VGGGWGKGKNAGRGRIAGGGRTKEGTGKCRAGFSELQLKNVVGGTSRKEGERGSSRVDGKRRTLHWMGEKSRRSGFQ